MRRVRRVAYEHDVLVAPVGISNGREAPPEGAIRDELVSFELLSEKTLAECDRVRLGRAVHSRGAPGRLGRFDDEGRRARLVLICVHAPESVRIMLEVEG